VADNILLFAYDALLDPDELTRSAPSAEFLFTAHYPETRLDFAADGDGAPGPTLVKDPGHTVWGAVFSISRAEADSLTAAMGDTGRIPRLEDQKAVDRDGNKHDCLTFVVPGKPTDERPSVPTSRRWCAERATGSFPQGGSSAWRTWPRSPCRPDQALSETENIR
jgi:hypothetical protein